MTNFEAVILQIKLYMAGMRSWESLTPVARRVFMANRRRMISFIHRERRRQQLH